MLKAPYVNICGRPVSVRVHMRSCCHRRDVPADHDDTVTAVVFETETRWINPGNHGNEHEVRKCSHPRTSHFNLGPSVQTWILVRGDRPSPLGCVSAGKRPAGRVTTSKVTKKKNNKQNKNKSKRWVSCFLSGGNKIEIMDTSASGHSPRTTRR